MKCQACGREWPKAVKFCGACGTKLQTTSALGSEQAEQVNERLKELLPLLGLAQFREIRPGIHVGQKGSTHVQVRVVPLGAQIAVRSSSPVTIGTPLTEDLLRFLLTENGNLLFGAFAIGSKGEVGYSHTIIASSMDVHELGASVSCVVNTADKYDDEIVKRWGGKTARQMSVDQVLAPALLVALLKSRTRSPKTEKSPAPAEAPTQPRKRAEIKATIWDDRSQRIEAIKVGSVAGEYAYVARQKCSCGGSYSRDAQSLLQKDGKMFDELAVSCTQCGSERKFLFDINAFFGSALKR